MNGTLVKKNIQRDSRIEILRLFACFFVLILHFKPGTFINGQRILSRVLVTSLCTDAVGIFLIITGLYFFRGQNYTAKLKSCFKTILLPTAVYMLFICLCYPLMFGASIDFSSVAEQIAKSIISWNPIIHNTKHLWYMFLYALIVLVFPVLSFIRNRFLTKEWQKYAFIAATLCFFLLNDYTNNAVLKSEMVPFTVFLPGCLLVLTGSILSDKKEKFAGKPLYFVTGIGIYLVVNILRARIICSLLNTDSSLTHLYGWYTSAGLICAISLSVAVLSIKPFSNKIINTIASTTMDVYILHVIVSEIISGLGYKTWIINTFLSGGESFTEYIKFTGIYSLSVFVICCIISLSIKKYFKFFQKIQYKKRTVLA